MSRLNITLLGPFQVTNDAVPITQFEADTARALLAYLAMQPALAFPRESLSDLLWPEQWRSDSLVALRQTLARLRRAIDDAGADPPFLTITRQSIEFNAESDYRLDVAAFTQQIAAVQSHRHRRLEACQRCMQKLERAANLYRGDFLTGFMLDSLPFEEWVLMERERLHQQAMDTFYHLATYHHLHGNYEQMQHYARRQLALEPWREEAHRQLLVALALSGQRSAALSHYKTVRDTLMEELGVEPTDETEQLLAQIRDGTLAQEVTPPHNLPNQLTSFVGRERELARIVGRLEDPSCRLLTLVGAGGVGKTRLALKVAEQMAFHFQHGVWFVPFVDITLSQGAPGGFERNTWHNQLATAVATCLGLDFAGQAHPKQQLLQALASREILLILDNFEHLIGAADFVVDMLAAAPRLTVLATSRARLDLRAEQVVKLKGLPVPQKRAPHAADYGSVQLFYKRGQSVAEDFRLDDSTLPHVIRLCRLLKGLPLGIELASTWVNRLPLADIVANLRRDIDFLSVTHQDVPKRHRRLRAIFESSWQLLSQTEQQTLSQLSIFRGDFSYTAAQAITHVNLAELGSLVDKSLLPTGAPGRYIVHEMLRQFAAEKLATDEKFPVNSESAVPDGQDADSLYKIRERHARYYLAFIVEQTPALYGAEPQRAVAEVQLEMSNVRHAWQWAVAHLQPFAGDILPDVLADCVEGLMRFYDLKGLFQEGTEMFGAAVARLQEAPQVATYALTRFSMAQAHFLEAQSDYNTAMLLLQHALSLAKQIEPADGVETRRSQMDLLKLSGDCYHKLGDYVPAEMCYVQSLELGRQLESLPGQARAHRGLGDLAWKQGDLNRAQERYTQSLAIWRKTCDKKSIAENLNDLGKTAYLQSQPAEAQQYLEEALALHRQIGDRRGIADSRANLGSIFFQRGDFSTAKRYYVENLTSRREIGDRRAMAASLNNLGLLAYWQRDYHAAYAYHQESLAIKRSIGDRWGEAFSLCTLGYITVYWDKPAAWDFCAQALAIRREIGDQRGVVESLNSLGYVACQKKDYAIARQQFESGLALAREINHSSAISESLLALAILCFQQDRFEESRRYCYEMLSVSQGQGFAPDILMAVLILARLLWRQGAHHKSAELLGVVRSHPFLHPDGESHIQELHMDLTTTLSPDELESALENGKTLALDAVVADLLAGSTLPA